MNRLLFCVLFVALLGCASMTGTVRRQAAAEYHCTAEAVQVEEISGNTYRAVGCGQDAIYTCLRLRDPLWGTYDTMCRR